MKLSKYVFEVKKNNEHLLVNLFNGAVVSIDDNDYQCMLNEKKPVANNTMEFLIKKNFFVYSEGNTQDIDFDKYVSININITNACNFNCKYCYFKANNKEKQLLSIDTDKFLNWFDQYILPQKKDVFVNYLGGEPLLKIDKILLISNMIQKRIKENSLNYFGEITTNGYFLSPHTAKALVQAGIKSLQVTLDGNRIEHNKIRNCKNNQGTYDRILDNICLCKNIIGIVVRINFNKKTNIHLIKELLVDLKDRDIQQIYFSAIEDNYLEENASAEENEYALSSEKAIQMYLKIWKLQKKMGFALIQKIPPIIGNCIAQNPNGYTINYDGKMFICPSACGISKFYVDNLYDFKANIKRMRDKTKNCRTCFLYPICMGGCEIIHSIHHDNNYCNKSYIVKLLSNYFELKYLDKF